MHELNENISHPNYNKDRTISSSFHCFSSSMILTCDISRLSRVPSVRALPQARISLFDFLIAGAFVREEKVNAGVKHGKGLIYVFPYLCLYAKISKVYKS